MLQMNQLSLGLRLSVDSICDACKYITVRVMDETMTFFFD